MTSNWDVAFSIALCKVTSDNLDIDEELYIMHRRQDHIQQFLHVVVALKNEIAVRKTRRWLTKPMWESTTELAKKNNINL
jgi:hypothetical protein